MFQNIFLSKDDVYLWDDKRGLVTFPVKEYDYAYRKNPNGQHVTFTGERCSKTRRYSRNEPDVFESDLPVETRVLTDIYLDSDEPSVGHRVVLFDIEVSMEGALPNVETANNEITSIALYDYVTEEYHVVVLDKAGNKDSYTKDNVYVSFYTNEFDLLYQFVELWESINPTIISGWNSDGFDVPYLYRRLQNVLGNNHANRLSCINKVKWSTYRQKYQIGGLSSLDYLDLYKKFTYNELPNYRLDTVGKIELGMGKIEYDGTLDELFENDLDKFIEYNIRDVEIIVGLEKKMQLIELVRGICHISHVPYEDYCYSSRFLEGTIVTYLHRQNLIVTDKDPNAREMMNNRDGVEFSGAYVKTPSPAKYDWVYSLDLQSLYPSIIMSLNISPETKIGKVTNWNNKAYLDGSLDRYVVECDDNNAIMTRAEIKQFIEDMNFAISSNGILYRQDMKGVIPTILEKWFEERVEYKDLMKKYSNEGNTELADFYDRRQHIQKIFLNSLYGVLGLPIFRFFDIDNALAVTAVGQDVIKSSETFVNGLYEELEAAPRSPEEVARYNIALRKEAVKRKETPEIASDRDWCIYIDTDSLYFSSVPLQHKMSGDPQADTIKCARFVEDKLNEYYNDMSIQWFNCKDHKFHIKGEVIASSAIWIVKKRYAMLKVYDLEKNMEMEPKMAVKGLDIVRSSFPIKFKQYMQDFIVTLLGDVDKDGVDDSMLEFYNHIKEVPYREIARNTAVKELSKYIEGDRLGAFAKGAPMHVKSAISYNQLLKEFGIDTKYPPITDGEKIKYILLKPNPYSLDTLAFKDYEDPTEIANFLEEYCDHTKIFNVELKKKLKDFYNAMGWGELPMDVNLKATEFFAF
jgi:DNA polymerase elongation subunit (family B)